MSRRLGSYNVAILCLMLLANLNTAFRRSYLSMKPNLSLLTQSQSIHTDTTRADDTIDVQPGRLKIKKIVEAREDILGRAVTIKGWIKTIRDQKKFSFLEINDGSTILNLQVIAEESISSYNQVQQLSTGQVTVHYMYWLNYIYSRCYQCRFDIHVRICRLYELHSVMYRVDLN